MLTVIILAMLSAPAAAQTSPLNEPIEEVPGVRPTAPRPAEPPGQRQTREQVAEKAGITPFGRIENRIQNRVQSRINNRINGDYRTQSDATSSFVIASDQARITGRPRR